MSWRYLAPAYSPVSTGSIAGALKGLARRPARVEEWLASRFSVDAALLVDSGTSALRLAIQALATPAAPRVRVALPAFGCYDLATAAIGAGADVSFYDLDPATLGPRWDCYGSTLAAGVDAVVLVHQYGLPVDLDRARRLAEAHGALVIEDAAQGAGAWWRGRRLGAWGDLGVLSFGRGKGMTAGGGGALLATGLRGQQLLAQARGRLADGGRGAGSVARLAVQALLSHPLVYGVPARMPFLALGDTPFHSPWEPRSIAASEAGVIASAAELADEEAANRRALATRFAASLRDQRGVALIEPPSGEGTQPGWLRFPAVLDGDSRGRAGGQAFRRLGIMPGYPRPLPVLPGFGNVTRSLSWPGATRLSAGLVTLPTHRWVAASDLDAALALLRE
jgi:dTDP-4-amino-4,6-dideoxygalactose transaminase